MQFEKMGLQRKTLEKIARINGLMKVYGTLTVRQVYYQLVSTGDNYRRVQYACQVGREQGLIDLDKIVDRSRPSYGLDVWSDFREVLGYYSEHFKLDYWKDEPYRVEIWTEKDALSAVLNEVAEPYRVPVRVTRGFISTSKCHEWADPTAKVLYFGDHDPSGLCMDKSIEESIFTDFKDFKRVALTMDQVMAYKLPGIPIKEASEDGGGDSRSPAYKEKFGDICWELDALPPDVLRRLVRESIEALLSFDIEQKRAEEQGQRGLFKALLEG